MINEGSEKLLQDILLKIFLDNPKWLKPEIAA
jgi:hypothetical protein